MEASSPIYSSLQTPLVQSFLLLPSLSSHVFHVCGFHKKFCVRGLRNPYPWPLIGTPDLRSSPLNLQLALKFYPNGPVLNASVCPITPGPILVFSSPFPGFMTLWMTLQWAWLTWLAKNSGAAHCGRSLSQGLAAYWLSMEQTISRTHFWEKAKGFTSGLAKSCLFLPNLSFFSSSMFLFVH